VPSIQILQASIIIVRRPKYLLMSSVVGWKQSRRRAACYTSRCPGITQKFSVVNNTFLLIKQRFHVKARIVRFDSISTFNVPRSLSVRLRPPSWFSVSQYKFSREKINFSHTKYNVYEPINSSSHLLTSNHNL